MEEQKYSKSGSDLMNYKMIIDNRDKFKVYLKENADLNFSNEVKVNGKEHNVEFVNFDRHGNIRSVFIDNKYYDVEIEKGPDGIPENIVIDGQKYPVQFTRVGRDRFIVKQEARVKSGKIVALIPGKVINLMVKTGDQVNEGDLVLLLEAMKMENEIAAPRSGVVKQILVDENDNVEKGQVMVVIE